MPRDYETPEYLRRLPAAEHAAVEVELLLSEPEVAREVLRQLDEALHPWGEPGEWPEPGTDCWVLYRDEVHDSLVLLEDIEVDVGEWETLPAVFLPSWDETFWSTSEEGRTMRFRKRWTPEAPETTARPTPR